MLPRQLSVFSNQDCGRCRYRGYNATVNWLQLCDYADVCTCIWWTSRTH